MGVLYLAVFIEKQAQRRIKGYHLAEALGRKAITWI